MNDIDLWDDIEFAEKLSKDKGLDECCRKEWEKEYKRLMKKFYKLYIEN